MLKHLSLLAALSLALTLSAKDEELFFEGDFSRNSPYGIGSGAFSVSKTTGISERKTEADGNGYLELKTVEGKTACQARIMLFPRRSLCGLTFKLTGRLKGQGIARFGFFHSVEFDGDGPQYLDKLALTDQWQEFEQTIDLSQAAPDRFNILLRAEGENSRVDLDDLHLFTERNEQVTITAEPGCPVLPDNTQLPDQHFRVTPADLTGNFLHVTPDLKVQVIPATAKDGIVTCPGFLLTPGLHRLAFAAQGNSEFRDYYATDAERCRELREAAEQIKLPGDQHWLMLADSLTDYARKHNHLDILAYFLNEANPGKTFTYRNAACGGDQARRIHARLTAGPDCYRSYMYNGLFDAKYDRICISLGQNDTVAFKETNFQKPQFSTTAVNEALRKILDILKQHNPDAPVTIYSGVSTPTEVNEANAPSYGYKFGVPNLVEDFNLTVQKVTADYGYDYFDIYTPLAQLAASKKEYFREDGVHFSQKGHLFAALQELKYFAKIYSK